MAPPAGIEPAPQASEAGALSAELRGRVNKNMIPCWMKGVNPLVAPEEFTNADSKVVFAMSSYAMDCLMNDSVYRREAVPALPVSPGGCNCSGGTTSCHYIELLREGLKIVCQRTGFCFAVEGGVVGVSSSV